jgi:hypothetical protein
MLLDKKTLGLAKLASKDEWTLKPLDAITIVLQQSWE